MDPFNHIARAVVSRQPELKSPRQEPAAFDRRRLDTGSRGYGSCPVISRRMSRARSLSGSAGKSRS